jgi:UV excision repair protein RAD23
MVEMGFEEAQVMRALKASFNNPDRAVEYLMNGIPDHLLAGPERAAAQAPSAEGSSATPEREITNPPPVSAQATPASAPTAPQNLFQAAAQAQQGQQNPAAAAAGGGSGSGLGPAEIERLRNNPMFQQIRDLVGSNPQLLQPMIQQLAAASPGLAQQLASNPELLISLLGGSAEGAEGEGEEWQEGAQGAVPPGAQVINVTPEEREAIARLEALGFPRQAAVEAYFACDKNEELAANFLFEGGFQE